MVKKRQLIGVPLHRFRKYAVENVNKYNAVNNKFWCGYIFRDYTLGWGEEDKDEEEDRIRGLIIGLIKDIDLDLQKQYPLHRIKYVNWDWGYRESANIKH